MRRQSLNAEESKAGGPLLAIQKTKVRSVGILSLLLTILNQELSGEEVIVVSNRHPYIYYFFEGRIEVQSPPSVLVTALKPVLKACSRVWVELHKIMILCNVESLQQYRDYKEDPCQVF